MSDLKGTINYLKFVRDICKSWENCQYCPFGDYEVCPSSIPCEWTDSDINNMLDYAYKIQKGCE